jgi:hypothetical protein
VSLRILERRRQLAQPMTPARVVLASTGRPFAPSAVARAAQLAGGTRVQVVSVARIHGSAFGLQHPGLLPNRKERDGQRDIVARAIEGLADAGAAAGGEVVVTRSPARSFARIARLVTASYVVIDAAGAGPLARRSRRVTAAAVRFRLRRRHPVEVILAS